MSQSEVLEVLKKKNGKTCREIAEILKKGFSSTSSCLRRLRKEGVIYFELRKNIYNGKIERVYYGCRS